MLRIASCLALTAMLAGLAACNSPASDEAFARTMVTRAALSPSEPLRSPDSEGAVWSAGSTQARIVYGKPGSTPLLALECETADEKPAIRITRLAPADEGAGAMLALIGNGHRARFAVDAVWDGQQRFWEGTVAAHDPALDVLTGRREVTATIPGAGELLINPGSAAGELIRRCRGEGAAHVL
ncbi:MAG: hypothetical protein APF82_04230 [Sphingomonadales bacterium BRH_c42]|nr:MAG: hypothetical protein APF82_04230 [Sphingomonadales bacterium BRH_c42]